MLLLQALGFAALVAAVALALNGPLSAPVAASGLLASASAGAAALWLSLSPYREQYADVSKTAPDPHRANDARLVRMLWWDAAFSYVLWMLLGFGGALLLTEGLRLLTAHQGMLLQIYVLLMMPLVAASESGGTAHKHLKADWVPQVKKIKGRALLFGTGVFGLFVIHGTLGWVEAPWFEQLRTTGGLFFEVIYVSAIACLVWIGFSALWRGTKKAMAPDEGRRTAKRQARREAAKASKEKQIQVRTEKAEQTTAQHDQTTSGEEVLDEHVRQMLDLPDAAFFLLLSRDLSRALQENEQHAAETEFSKSAARELIESHILSLDIAAGIRPDQDDGFDGEYFERRISRDDTFGMELLTQWYRFRTAYVQFQVSSDPSEREACKHDMMNANDVMFIANAQTFGWDYVPSALQTAADLDCLAMVQQHGAVAALENLSVSPFVALFTEKKLAERLVDPTALGLTGAYATVDDGAADTQTVSIVPIDPYAPTHDSWVEECFGLSISEQPDDRQYFDMAGFNEAWDEIMYGPPAAAETAAAALAARYPDFDVSYTMLANAQARGGDADRAIKTLMKGLEEARFKAPICHTLGMIMFEDKKELMPAVMWWLRSCAIQLGEGGESEYDPPFLNLSAIANSFPSLDRERDWLLEQADRINPARLRFDEIGMGLRHRMAIDQYDASIVTGIQYLYCHYRAA